MTTQKLPGIKNILARSIDLYKKHFYSLARVAAIAFLASVLAPVAIILVATLLALVTYPPIIFIPAFALVVFAFLYIGSWETLAMIAVVVDKTDSARTAYKATRTRALPFTMVVLFSMLAGFSGTLLLIVPGIMLFGYLAFVDMTFYKEGLHGIAALSRSFELVRGRLGAILWRSLPVTIGLFALDILIAEYISDALDIVFFAIVTTPLLTIYGIVMYRDICDAPPLALKKKAAPKTIIIAFVVLGALVLATLMGSAPMLIKKIESLNETDIVNKYLD